MSRSFSLYLDLVRFLAAVLVVLSHYIGFGILDKTIAARSPELGREAVIVFFVLSGYVISYTTSINKDSLRNYVVARCARIYSVAAPVLLIAFAVAYMAMVIGNNEVADQYTIEKAYFYIPFHLLFLGEVWNVSEVPPWLGAYWSLGFEVWYYIFFGALFYLRGASRIAVGAIVFLIMGHKLWLLMPVWFSGVLLYKHQQRFSVSERNARIGWVVTLVLLASFKSLELDVFLRELGNRIWMFPNLELGSTDRYLADYVVSVLVISNFFFAFHARFRLIDLFASAIKFLSSYTFTLYLIHGVVMSAWVYFYTDRTTEFNDVLLLSMLIALVTYVVGGVTEHQKALFQRFFAFALEIFDRFIRKTASLQSPK